MKRKAEFLARMESLMSWAGFCLLTEPKYPKTSNGPPRGLERIPRMYSRTMQTTEIYTATGIAARCASGFLAATAMTIALMVTPGSEAMAEPETPASIVTLAPNQIASMLPNLRSGGYVFYFRHAETRVEREDQYPINLNDCGTQRQLSEKGRRQAVIIGEAFHRLRIPVGNVLSSPFCRAVETAQLAFGEHEVSNDLYFALRLAQSERKAKGDWLRNRLSSRPLPGTNNVIVAHTANLDEAVGLWPKPEGVALIFLPDGKGGTQTIGRIMPETWPMIHSGAR